jgi:hypothetical protein
MPAASQMSLADFWSDVVALDPKTAKRVALGVQVAIVEAVGGDVRLSRRQPFLDDGVGEVEPFTPQPRLCQPSVRFGFGENHILLKRRRVQHQLQRRAGLKEQQAFGHVLRMPDFHLPGPGGHDGVQPAGFRPAQNLINIGVVGTEHAAILADGAVIAKAPAPEPDLTTL